MGLAELKNNDKTQQAAGMHVMTHLNTEKTKKCWICCAHEQIKSMVKISQEEHRMQGWGGGAAGEGTD